MRASKPLRFCAKIQLQRSVISVERHSQNNPELRRCGIFRSHRPPTTPAFDSPKVIIFLLISSALLFASLDTSYDKSKPPPMSLSEAYFHAMTALGAETNRFHCISATIPEVVPSTITQPVWLFTFYSTNTPTKTRLVNIEMNTKRELLIAK